PVFQQIHGLCVIEATNIQNQIFINALPPRKMQTKPRLNHRTPEQLVPQHSGTKLKRTKPLKNVVVNLLRTPKPQLWCNHLTLLCNPVGTADYDINIIIYRSRKQSLKHVRPRKVVRV